jgi:hypothetical protein
MAQSHKLELYENNNEGTVPAFVWRVWGNTRKRPPLLHFKVIFEHVLKSLEMSRPFLSKHIAQSYSRKL